MAYRLENNETLGFGLKRIVLERIDKSIFDLSKNNGSINDEIHDCRKNFKKIRTVLRLVRSKIGNDIFRYENSFYRDSGKTLSDLRDSTVLIQTFDKLIGNDDVDKEKFEFSSFRNLLLEKHKQLNSNDNLQKDIINSLSTDIILARSRVFDWSFTGDNFKIILDDFQRIYEAGQTQMKNVLEEAIKENVHEWRKRAKDLWYSLRILSNIWPEIMSPLIIMLGSLTDLLGDTNDLFILKQEIMANEDTFDNTNQAREIINFINKQIIDFLREAKFIGRRIYSEKSAYFAGRMRNYYEIWRGEYKPLKYYYV